MKRSQLLRDFARDAKARGLLLSVDMARGKGGHCVVRCGTAFTVIKSGEIAADGANHPQAARPIGPVERLMDYLAQFIEDEGAAFVVTFPAFPEANTGGGNQEEALENAQEALDLTVLTYVKDGRALPPSETSPQSGGAFYRLSVSAYAMAKIALIEVFRASGLSQTTFAKRLGKAETEVRRMLDPYHATKLASIELGLRVLGKRLVLSVEAAA